MRKLLVTAMAGGLLAGGAWLLPASAEQVIVPGVGYIEAEGEGTTGHVAANGEDTNGQYLGGWIVVGNDSYGGADGTENHVCADDGGTPDGGGTPSCDEGIITGLAGQ